MRKLIIGCGYLGHRIAAAWLADGHEVSALTRSPRHAEKLQAAGITPIIGDVTAPATLSKLPAADTLLFAVGFDRTAGLSQRTVYVDGLTNVLQEVRDRIGKLIYISSSSVYGQQDGEWIDEASPTLPSTSSGQVCLQAEQVVREFFPSKSQCTEPAAVVLRLSGIYGPKRLLRRIEAVRSQEPVAGDPRAWLNLIHVDDAVAAVRATAIKAEHGSTYLVSDDRPVSRQEYFDRLAALVGAHPPVFDPLSANGLRVSGLGKRCSNRKLCDELGVELQFPTNETGLPHAVGRNA
jgi:nucleoside-diphosphate-sugar epimerase